MMITDIPNETLMKIFYNLDYNDLYNISLVCKHWKTVSDDDILWKRLCFNYIDYLEPSYKSYKKRFFVIRNILESKYTISSHYDTDNVDRRIMLSTNGDIIKLYIDPIDDRQIIIKKISCISSYSIEDKGQNKYLSLTNLDQGTKIILTYISASKCFLIDNICNIHIYDNCTLQLLNTIKISQISNVSVEPYKLNLYSNEELDEIIFSIKDEIYVIDIITSDIKYCVDVSNIINGSVNFMKIRCTKNHIIFHTFDHYTTKCKAYIINKNILSVEEFYLPYTSMGIHDLDTYNNYLVILTKDNTIRIYIDQCNDIKYIRDIYLFMIIFTIYSPVIKIYNGLIYINHRRKTLIFNIHKGEILSTIEHNYITSNIVTNGSHLLIFGIKSKSLYSRYSYTLYDYTKYISDPCLSSTISTCLIL